MPITEIYFPILSRFLCAVEMTTGLPAQPLDAPPEQRQRVEQEDEKKALPKGVVLGPDGKPYVYTLMLKYSKTTANVNTQMPLLHLRLLMDGHGPLSTRLKRQATRRNLN